MREHMVRILLLCVLLLLVTSDLSDLLSNSPTLASVSHLIGKAHGKINKDKRTMRNSQMTSDESPSNWVKGEQELMNSKLVRQGALEVASSGNSASALSGIALTDEEKEQLVLLKKEWMNVMQQYCLPKLVCELHAAVTDGSAMSDAERELLSLIKDTSLGTAGEIVSKYHFAAHMGQMLSGVEGNGCHNFYPNCPISGTRVLQMVRRVRVST